MFPGDQVPLGILSAWEPCGGILCANIPMTYRAISKIVKNSASRKKSTIPSQVPSTHGLPQNGSHWIQLQDSQSLGDVGPSTGRWGFPMQPASKRAQLFPGRLLMFTVPYSLTITCEQESYCARWSFTFHSYWIFFWSNVSVARIATAPLTFGIGRLYRGPGPTDPARLCWSTMDVFNYHNVDGYRPAKPLLKYLGKQWGR